MRHSLLVAALLALLPCSALAADAQVEALATKVDGKVQVWRRDIHQHPELGNREVRTAKLVAEHLRALGFDDVRTGIATTGVTAVLRGGQPGPRIALRRHGRAAGDRTQRPAVRFQGDLDLPR